MIISAMDSLSMFLVLLGFYMVLLFFDVFFKSCAHYPYISLLDFCGIKINFLTIKWKTRTFNRVLLKWGNNRPKLLKMWFDTGIFVTLVLVPISVMFLFYNIFQLCFRTKSSISNTPVIEAVIPGVNLPFSELGYYCLTLLVCSSIHEIGHALAAVLEDVTVTDIGCNLYFILPVAYVNISTEKFLSVNYKRRLRVVCAGVWHNVVLSFFVYLIYCSLPGIFSGFYATGKGVTVSHITNNSPLKNTSKGLNVGDVIFKINDCPVFDEASWYACLTSENFLKTAYCIESDLIHNLDESVPIKHNSQGNIECCDLQNKKNLCFQYVDKESTVLEIPSHVCLPARTIVEKTDTLCTLEPHVCPNDFYCFRPVLGNYTYLINIVGTKNVIYLGLGSDLYQTIDISSYISKSKSYSTKLPDIVTRFCKYLIVISLGLGLVNILPITYMDGQHIIEATFMMLFKKKIGKKATEFSIMVVTWFFTFLLVIFLVYTISSSF